MMDLDEFKELQKRFIAEGNAILLPKPPKEEFKTFLRKLVIAKSKETLYKNDPYKMYDRISVGHEGEWALKLYLNIPFDDSIGDSSKYDKPDIMEYRGALMIGVKTAKIGNPHVFHIRNIHPQFIVVRDDDGENYLFGVASIELLKKYHDDNCFFKKQDKPTKTALRPEAYDHLLTLDQLNQIIDKNVRKEELFR